MQMKNLARLETIAKGMPQSIDVSPPPGVFVQIILHAGLLSNLWVCTSFYTPICEE